MNTEIQHTNPTTDENFKDPFSPLLKECDEFSSFEETFDPTFLRKFFREHDSALSQSSHSPHKDNLMIEETHSFTTAESQSQLSPHRQDLKSTNDTINMPKNPRPEFSFNFNLNPKVFEVKRLANTGRPSQYQRSCSFNIGANSSNIHLVMRKGSMTVSSYDPITQANMNLSKRYLQDKSLGIPYLTKIQSEQEKEKARFERLLKKKKVFKVIRDQNPARITPRRNIKRIASAPIEEEDIMPKLKQVKSQPKSQNSRGTPEYFTFNIPLDFGSNNGTCFSFPNQAQPFQPQNYPNQNFYTFQNGNQIPELDFFSKF